MALALTASDVAVYKGNSLSEMMQNIRQKHHLRKYINPRFKGKFKLAFSNDERILGCLTPQQVFCYDLTSEVVAPSYVYNLSHRYEHIADFRMLPDGSDAYIAAKQDGWTNIHLFFTKKPDQIKSLRYEGNKKT